MKKISNSEKPSDSIIEMYALAKDLYVNQGKDAFEIRLTLKQKKITEDTIEFILNDIQLCTEINAKIKSNSLSLIGLFTIVFVFFIYMLNPDISLQNDLNNCCALILLTLGGIVLSFKSSFQSFKKKLIKRYN